MSGNLEVVSSRVFARPRDEVFDAFQDPERLVRWWGPKEFTTTLHTFELRPGGTWHLTLHGPDGAKYENRKIFVEVVPPERVVLDHTQAMHNFRMVMTYEDLGGRTKLTWLMHFEGEADNQQLKSIIAAANEENFDRLEAHLSE